MKKASWPSVEIYAQEMELAKKEMEKLISGAVENKAMNLSSYLPYNLEFIREFETDHGTFNLYAKVSPK